MNAITQTLTRPVRDDRLTLEITTPSGRRYSFEINAAPYYHAVAEILRNEKALACVVDEPLSPASTFEPAIGNAS